jgi:hypothetical protein
VVPLVSTIPAGAAGRRSCPRQLSNRAINESAAGVVAVGSGVAEVEVGATVDCVVVADVVVEDGVTEVAEDEDAGALSTEL